MQVRCCLIQMEMSGKHTQGRIPFLKTFYIFIPYSCCNLSIRRFRSHIIFISNLKDYLMKWFFLLSRTDFFIMIFDLSLSALHYTFQVPHQIIHGIFLEYPDSVFHIPVTPFRICILCMEFSAVVVDKALPCYKADCPLQ